MIERSSQMFICIAFIVSYVREPTFPGTITGTAGVVGTTATIGVWSENRQIDASL